MLIKRITQSNMQSVQAKISIPTIEGVKKQWEDLGDNYSLMDSCPQTFFYSLSNLLKLDSASKILQIACGTGKMIPMVLDLKKPNAQYFATDISQKMLSLLRLRLQQHFDKYQSKLTLDQWIEKMNLKIKLVNGQQDLHSQISDQKPQNLIEFDRIIANLVLMLTPDPQKMLKNLFNHSKSGCLFGLTVWGNKSDNNVQTWFPQLSKQYGFPQGPSSRSNFFLYKKVTQIAEKAGWEIVLNWDQKGIFPFLTAQEFRPYGHLCAVRMPHLSPDQQKQLEDGFVNKMHQYIESRKALTFAGECYIFRKK